MNNDDDDNVVQLEQQRSAKLLQQARKHALLETLLATLVHQRKTHDDHAILDAIIRVLVLLAGDAKVSGGSVLRRVAHEMDMVWASGRSTNEFAKWFVREVPLGANAVQDFEVYPDNKSPYPEE